METYRHPGCLHPDTLRLRQAALAEGRPWSDVAAPVKGDPGLPKARRAKRARA